MVSSKMLSVFDVVVHEVPVSAVVDAVDYTIIVENISMSPLWA